MARKVIIMGAAGRDFHNFNVLFKNNPLYKVVCFTAAQIPGIAKRSFPKLLAGRRYSRDIPIHPEESLPKLIRKHKIDEVYLSYSDLPFKEVMQKAGVVSKAGAEFVLAPAQKTMIKSTKPVIAICAVRTGCGKSSVSQKVAMYLKKKGKRVVVVRHPMPYGDLAKQVCQRFASYADFRKHNCTIEEREEYEPYIEKGMIIYAGVDYEKILRKAEKEADIIIWDGGNNDTPFFKPDLHITLVDPHRPGHELTYYPGFTNLILADVVIINKADSAKKSNIRLVEQHVKSVNPTAKVIESASVIEVDKPRFIRNKKVVVVEDGPTLTHGGMSYGAGMLAAKKYNAKPVNPRPFAVGSIKKIYKKFPKLGPLLPAMGYGNAQQAELEKTINTMLAKGHADAVIAADPINLGQLLNLHKPTVRIRYHVEEMGKLKISKVLQPFLKKARTKKVKKRKPKKPVRSKKRRS